MNKKITYYKGWRIEHDALSGEYLLYTPEELELPFDARQEEAIVSTLEQAKTFIDHYNDYDNE